MGASVYRFNSTGGGAVALSASVPVGQCYRLVSVTAHFGVAPAAAGSLTVTLDAAEGSDYDLLLNTESMVGLTDYAWLPDQDYLILGGDAVRVAYANPNSRVYGVRITLKAV